MYDSPVGWGRAVSEMHINLSLSNCIILLPLTTENNSKLELLYPQLFKRPVRYIIQTISPTYPLSSEIALDKVTLGRKRSVVQLRLAHDHQATIAGELEVGSGAARVDLADKLARGIPDVHAVADTGVDVALAVAMDAFTNCQH